MSVLVRCLQLSSPLHLPPYLSSPHERIPSEQRPFEILPACLFLSSTRVFRGLHLCSSPLLSSPPLLASKEFTLYLLTHTSTHACTHGARRSIFTVSLFFFVIILFNESKHWPCSPLPPSERPRLFAAQSSVGLVLVRLIRSWESIVVVVVTRGRPKETIRVLD